ncbi:unnamed protein product, partial [marine sediment metagenome]
SRERGTQGKAGGRDTFPWHPPNKLIPIPCRSPRPTPWHTAKTYR